MPTAVCLREGVESQRFLPTPAAKHPASGRRVCYMNVYAGNFTAPTQEFRTKEYCASSPDSRNQPVMF